MNNIVFLSYEDRRSHSVLPYHLKQRNAQRADIRHDKPSANTSASNQKNRTFVKYEQEFTDKKQYG